MAEQCEMEMNRLSPTLLASWLQGINHRNEELPAKHTHPRLPPPEVGEGADGEGADSVVHGRSYREG